MSNARNEALYFVEHEKAFHLGFLPTEQSHVLTRTLEEDFAKSPADGVRTLQRVDREVLKMAKNVFAGKEFAALVDAIYNALSNGKRVIFSGCGATGRLSILLESLWRDACASGRLPAEYADQLASIMTGGDFALVRSVEFFEDYHSFGRRQVKELGVKKEDVLVAITEGGETSSVLGTAEQALEEGAKVFILFNNPAELLAENLERSRKIIKDERVTVLDLCCGPMALAGSTRMQATTSEQLVAGAALESAGCRLMNVEAPAYAENFEKVLEALEAPRSVESIASCAAWEKEIYKARGLVTYFADDFLLDIFTDTTERSPTFMLPPFRKKEDVSSPLPWAFVKNPLYTTEEVWERAFKRPTRCLAWDGELLKSMGAPEAVWKKPPLISREDLFKIPVGKELLEDRFSRKPNGALLVTRGDAGQEELRKAYSSLAASFESPKTLSCGGSNGDFPIPAPELAPTPLRLMEHMLLKLVFNTLSTSTMVLLGRVSGNWMSYVDCTNKKLLDRGTRLISELAGLDYTQSCILLFEGMEECAGNVKTGEERIPVVPMVLAKLKKEGKI